ncbi:hypothetical protein H0X09_00915 [Candidatus Saccharibacteria bacterium]|nr:hypothetical protein [Candidatus Saccharibacteria bacterium]
MSRKNFINLVGAVILGVSSIFWASSAVSAQTNSDLEKVTICHRTNSVTNPYRQITVDKSAVDGHGENDHTQHTGPVATSQEVAQGLKDEKKKWGDIIPHGLNWTTVGMAVYNNGCQPLHAPEDPPVHQTRVKICHATGSESNPYVEITLNARGVINGHVGHDHQNGEDIIPPFEYMDKNKETKNFPGQNWNTNGQAIYNNHCKKPVHVVVQPPTPPPTPPAGHVNGASTTTTGVVLGAQVQAPVGAVSAGAGGAVGTSMGAIFGLSSSLGVLGLGLRQMRKFGL